MKLCNIVTIHCTLYTWCNTLILYSVGVGQRIFDICNTIFLLSLVVITLYPLYYVLIASVSDPMKIYTTGGLLLWPQDFSLGNYITALSYNPIWIGYRNTIFYVVVGGGLSVLLTVMGAYALTRRNLPGKNIVMFAIMFTMYFGGGLIPSYMVVKELGMLDTVWAVLLPGCVSTYNLIVTISYFRGLPYELEEAAKIDGAGDFTVLFKIMLPLAKPIIAVIALYYMVSIWNSYFGPMIYLDNPDLKPLQVVLREVLIQSKAEEEAATQGGAVEAYAEGMKYAVIIIATVPILCVYPFIQKYFVKGVTIGAVKG